MKFKFLNAMPLNINVAMAFAGTIVGFVTFLLPTISSAQQLDQTKPYITAPLNVSQNTVGKFLDNTNSHRLRVATLAMDLMFDPGMQERIPWLIEFATTENKKRIFDGMIEHDFKKTEPMFTGQPLLSGDASVGEFLTRHNGINKFDLSPDDRSIFEMTVEQFNQGDKAHMTEKWRSLGYTDDVSLRRLAMIEVVADLIDTTEARSEEFGKKMVSASEFTLKNIDNILADFTKSEQSQVITMMRHLERNPQIYHRATRDINAARVTPVLRQIRLKNQNFVHAAKQNFFKSGRPAFPIQTSCQTLSAIFQ